MTGIKKCDKKLLRSVAGVAKYDSYYKVRRNSGHLGKFCKRCVKFLQNSSENISAGVSFKFWEIFKSTFLQSTSGRLLLKIGLTVTRIGVFAYSENKFVQIL